MADHTARQLRDRIDHRADQMAELLIRREPVVGFSMSAVGTCAISSYPQFVTSIFDHDVHLIHVRLAEAAALPLMLTHGWPGSIIEFLDVIGPLTDPSTHGGDPADAFDGIVPTIPGFGIGGPTRSEWTTRRVAEAFSVLMNRLGYDRYAAHGGDYGSAISRHLGIVDADHVVALHLTALLSSSARSDSADPDNPEDQESLAKARRYQRELMATRWCNPPSRRP